MPIANGNTPLLLQGAELVLLTASSKLMTLTIPELCIGASEKLASMPKEELLNALQLSLGIGK